MASAWSRGLYGVEIDGAFAAESMFYLEPNASKLTLLFFIEQLRSAGLDWLDIQVLTPHMERLGARTIPRDAFLTRLRNTRERGLQLFSRPSGLTVQ
jgi:leucyl/phenylalanyl-tRNA--protein transferase